MKKSGEWPVTKSARHRQMVIGESASFSVHKLRLRGPLSSRGFFFLLTYNLKLTTYNLSLNARAFLIPLALLAASGCGYHIAGKSDALPKSIHVIAMPAIENKTSVYRIEQRLTAATVHEFLAKTSYRVVPEPGNADAVLRGKVLSLEAVPLLFDTATGRATTMLVTVKCEITFEERESGKVLYHTDNFVFRNEYEIPAVLEPGTSTVNPSSVSSFFQEQDPALDRLAQDFATRLVAAVTENY